ncbi:MAG: hypothetical protein QXT63_03140, partial [Thermoplasmata archaeon]
RIEVSNTTPSAKVRIESLAWSETSPVVNEIVSLKVSVRNIGSAVAYTQSGEEEVQTYPRVSIWPGIPGRYRIALVGMRSELRYSLGNDIGAGERSVVELKVSFSEKLEDMISVRIIEEGLGYVDTRPASEISVIEIVEYRNSITYGQGISATYNSRKDSSVCLPGCYQPAYAYYGIRDRVEFVKENGNLYANLDEPGKVVEYKMLIGGEISELKIYGLGQGLENGSAEAVSEVKANVYVDGIKRGEVILSEKDENVHERIINLTIPYCEHYVALECAGSYEGKGFRLVGLSTILKTSFRVDYRVYYTANKSYVKILASNITQGFVAYSEMSKIRISKIWLGSETNNPQIEILDVSMKEIAILNGVKKNDWLEFDISNIGLVEGLRYYIRIVLDKPIEYEFSYDIYPLGDAIIDGKEYYYLDAFIEVC